MRTVRPAPGRRVDRSRFLVALVLALACAVTGCTVGGGDEDAEPVQLSVFWWGDERRAELTERALRLYSRRHPEVTFRVTWQGSGGYYDRLATQAAGGNAPDLFQIDDDHLSEYARRSILLDLSGYVADHRLDLRPLPAALVNYGEVDGRTVAVAAAESSPAIAYNRTLLRRLNLPEPATGMSYEEFLRWATQVTQRSEGRVAGAMDAAGDQRALWLWLRSRGKEFYADGRLGFDADDLTGWFDIWRQAQAARATPAAAIVRTANGGAPSRQLVVTGAAAASFVSSHQLPALQAHTDDELALVGHPTDAQTHWPSASMYWAGFSGSRHPDLVADVIDFLTNDVEAGRILGVERGPSPNPSVRAAVRGELVEEPYLRVVAYHDEMATRFGTAPPPPPQGHATVRALLTQAAEDTQFSRATSRSAAQRFIRDANAALAN